MAGKHTAGTARTSLGNITTMTTIQLKRVTHIALKDRRPHPLRHSTANNPTNSIVPSMGYNVPTTTGTSLNKTSTSSRSYSSRLPVGDKSLHMPTKQPIESAGVIRYDIFRLWGALLHSAMFFRSWTAIAFAEVRRQHTMVDVLVVIS